jgi:hypothetical protein
MGLTINVNTKGVTDALGKVPAVLVSEINRAVKESYVSIQRDARKNHNFKTRSSNLIKSVSIDFKSIREPSRGVYLDTGKAKYGPMVHEGTKPHKITPKNKKKLRWANGGKFTFAKSVNHPGTKPDQFVYKAANDNQTKIITAISTAIDTAFAKLWLKK